jgi:hypothetical protein
LPISYPSVDFMPVKMKAAAKLERKRKVTVAAQFVNGAVRDLQIPSQFANRHERTGRGMTAMLHRAPVIRVHEKAKEHLSAQSEKADGTPTRWARRLF